MKIAEHHPEPEEASPLDDPRVSEVLEEYLAALETGLRPDRKAFVGRYPEIAEALSGCLQSLEAIHNAGPHLEPPAPPAPAVASSLDAQLPIGDFRILREVGRGGMGVVYEAVQLSLGRRVALKVLPFASALDQRQLQRFKNEAQAAAHLHHSHIVPVFAVGCERGVYYYAMQFIEGQTVAAYIQELRRQAGVETSSVVPMAVPVSTFVPPEDQPTVLCRPSADTRAAVETMAPAHLKTERSAGTPGYFQTVARLGVQAAEGLEHAHQRGVIHRDIKPANLLLDAQDHLWITDFGLARCQSEASLTTTGDLIGTLRYMSPEQALGRPGLVDHRTDIYALGATLFELLTLQPVFAGSDRHELLRQIAHDEPRPPRTVRPSVPRELETIVLKALGKSPEERYGSAQELADDLRRYLEDRPILARRPTLLERTNKWLRRHRKAALAAVGVLILAVVGLAYTTVRIAQEQARTEVALKAEADQRALAEESFRKAWQALDAFTQVAADDMADKPEMQAVRRRLLETARDYYQTFIDQRQDDPNIREALVQSHLRVGQILNEIGAPADAVASVEKALDVQKDLVRDHPAVTEYKNGLDSISRHLDLLRTGGRLFLLGQKSVQEELHLTEAQIKGVTGLLQAPGKPFDFRRAGPDEWRRQQDEFKSREKAIEGVLSAEQLRRLRQIDLQQQGVGAFADPALVQALNLSADQQLAIRQAYAPPAKHGWGKGPGPKANEPGKGLLEQIVGLLDDEQKALWEELRGETFKGEIRHGPQPMTGGRHRPPSP